MQCVLCAPAGMELWQLQAAAAHSGNGSNAGGSRLSDGADLAAGVELGSFDGSVDLGNDSGVHQDKADMCTFHVYMHTHMGIGQTAAIA